MNHKLTSFHGGKARARKRDISRRSVGDAPRGPATRPLPEIGQTETTPDPAADNLGEQPTTGTTSRGSASPRKV